MVSDCQAWPNGRDHAAAIRAKARRNFATVDASNGAKANRGNSTSCSVSRAGFRHTLDHFRTHQIDKQRQRRRGHQSARAERYDPEAAHFRFMPAKAGGGEAIKA